MEIKFVITNSYYKYKTVIKIRNRVSFHMIRNNEGIKTKALFLKALIIFISVYIKPYAWNRG